MRAVVVIIVLLWSVPSHGESNATRLTKEAVREYAKANFEASIKLLREAVALTRDASLLSRINLYLGCNHLELGEEMKADWRLIRALLKDPGLTPAPATFKANIRARFNGIKRSRFGIATFSSRPRGAEVLVAGRSLGRTPLAGLAVIPGVHRLEVRKKGHVPWVTRWSVAHGQEDRFEVTLAPHGQGRRGAPRTRADRKLLRRGKLCSVNGWCWENPLPMGPSYLNDVWGSGPSDVYVVGSGGTLAHYDGTTWVSPGVPVGSRVDLNGVWGTSPSDLFVVGSRGAVARYDGRRWARMKNSGTGADLLDVWGSSDSNVFAVGGHGAIIHFDGKAWSKMRSGTSAPLVSVWGSGASSVFAVGEPAAVFSYDGGSWRQALLPVGGPRWLTHVWGTGPGNVFVVGLARSGGFLRHDGKGWNKMRSALKTFHPSRPVKVRSVWGSGPTDVRAMTNRGRLGRLVAGKWIQGASLPSGIYRQMWGASATDIFVVGRSGLVLRLQGQHVNRLSPTRVLARDGIKDLWVHRPDQIYAVTGSGALLRHDGKRWTFAAAPPPRKVYYHSIWGTGPSNILVSGMGSTLFRFDGRRWSRIRLPFRSRAKPPSRLVSHIWGTGASDIYAAETLGIIRFNGKRWRQMRVRPSRKRWELLGIWGSNRRHIFAVGRDCAILRYRRTVWRPMACPTPKIDLRSVWGSGATDVFAVGDRGTILHFDGKRWQAMSSHTRVRLDAVWGTGPKNVYAVGGKGTILVYNGKDWRRMCSGTVRHLLGVSGSGAGDVHAVGEHGTILHRGTSRTR